MAVKLKRIRAVLQYPSLLFYAVAHPRISELKKRYLALHNLSTDAVYTPPLHGDVILQNLIGEIIDFFSVKNFFETGTYRGESLEYVCQHFNEKLRIFSCEINNSYYKYSTQRLTKYRPTIFNVSSPTAIHLTKYFSMLDSLTLFFLDAHWGEYWPLLDELGEIKRLKQAITIVDDFKVPKHPELGYDSYNGNENNLDYIGKVLDFKNCNVLLPNYQEDAGWLEPKRDMRGYVVVFMNLSDKFKEFSKLDLMKNFEVDT